MTSFACEIIDLYVHSINIHIIYIPGQVRFHEGAGEIEVSDLFA